MAREWHLVRRPRAHASHGNSAEMDPWLRSRRVVHRRSDVDGVERFPEVLLGHLRGGTTTTGKAVIRVEDQA